jgi:GTP-binding protein
VVTPPPSYTPGHPLQLLVTNLSANDYVGRMAVGRVVNGAIRVGQRIAVVREEPDDTSGAVEPGRTVTLSGTVTSLQTAHGIERVDIEEAGPGDIVSVAGLPRSRSATPHEPGDFGRCRASRSTSPPCG